MLTPLALRPTALYRFYAADGELLYVGITHSIEKRWATHRLLQTWWHLVDQKTVTWYPNRLAAAEVETAAIAAEHPRFDKTNIQNERDRPRTCYVDPRKAEIEAQLRADIDTEEYRNGRMLPFTTVFAERYKTSPATIAHLIWQLERERVVEGRGAHYWLRGCRPKR